MREVLGPDYLMEQEGSLWPQKEKSQEPTLERLRRLQRQNCSRQSQIPVCFILSSKRIWHRAGDTGWCRRQGAEGTPQPPNLCLGRCRWLTCARVHLRAKTHSCGDFCNCSEKATLHECL